MANGWSLPRVGSRHLLPEEHDDAEIAKEICDSCVVQVACLEHALTRREKVGVWGGATERERRRMIANVVVPPEGIGTFLLACPWQKSMS